MDFLNSIIAQVTVGQFLTYGFLAAIIIFIFAVITTSRKEGLPFHWIDLISNPDGTASLTRMLQLSAGLTGTWVIIKMTVAGNLTPEMFGLYLAAMGISEGFTKYIQSKGKDNA